MVEGALHPVGAGHGGDHLDAGGVAAGGGGGGGRLGAGGDHAVVDAAALGGGDHVHHLAVHAQQEGDGVAVGKAALAGELVGGCGGANGVAGAGHGDGGGGGTAGGDGGEGAGDPVAVDPHRPQVLIVVVHVVPAQGGEVGEAAVAVDGDVVGAEGQVDGGTGAGAHIGPLGVVGHQGGVVHLAVGDGVAQGGAVDRAGTVLGGEEVIEEGDTVLPGEGLALDGGEVVQQAHRLGLGELGVGEGAGQGRGVIAQQPQQSGAGLLQGDGVVGAEGAVHIAGEPALLHRQLDVAAGPVAALHVGEEGGGAGAHRVLVDRGGGHHLGELRPGHRGGEVQVAVFVAGEDAQHPDGLQHGVPVRRQGGRRGQREGQRQGGQKGEDALLHGSHSFNRSAGRRWG